MPSGLIPVEGKRRCGYQILVNILGDHARWWGADLDEARRRQRMILGVQAVDQQLVKAWGGTVTPGGPHSNGEISDPRGLASFLMEVYEGKRTSATGLVGRGTEDKYAFDDPASAVRGRALALLGSFPDDPAVVGFMRGRLSEGGRPEVQGLAAAGLVRLGQDAGVLDTFAAIRSRSGFSCPRARWALGREPRWRIRGTQEAGSPMDAPKAWVLS